MTDRLDQRRRHDEHRLADIAEPLVHRMRERVHERRLAFAGDNDGGAAVLLKIVDDRAKPVVRKR